MAQNASPVFFSEPAPPPEPVVLGVPSIPDMGVAGTYNGHLGRLYMNGATPSNTIPAAHAAAMAAAAAAIQPLDTAGSPSPTGKIVVLAIGMSNTRQEFDEFINIASPAPNVVLVNGAQTNMDAANWTNFAGSVWTEVDNRLATKSVTNDQVQVVWIKQAIAGPTGDFATHLAELKGYLKAIVQNVTGHYPNCQLVFFSPRTYGGYAGFGNPEPYAFETGFAVRDVIDDQVNGGDPDLAVGAAAPNGGTIPPMAWATYMDGSQWKGAYLWADGTNPNTQGTVWNLIDFEADGLHPAGTADGVSAPDGAEHKVAALLNLFFVNSPYTSSWWVQSFTLTTVGTINSNTTANSFNTASYTPTANRPQVVFVFSRAAVAATPNAPVLLGHSITYNMEERRVFSTEASPRSQCAVFYGLSATPTASVLNVTFAGQNQTVCNLIAIEFTGIDTGVGPVQSPSNSADSVANLTVTMAAQTTEDFIIAGFGNIIGASMNEEAGWVFYDEIEPAGSPLGTLMVEYLDGYDSSVYAERAGAGTMNFVGVALALKKS